MSLIVKIGKKGKRLVKKLLPEEKRHLSYTRRIERVKTAKRICAMTFDDGPMDMPVSPDRFDGRALTDVLLDILGEFGAKGTFDVIGDTSENYPDKAGKLGSAAWGGIKFDHYPDIGHDGKGGAVHNDRLIRRILAGGHQITNHGYRHIIFGKKPFVYGAREYLGSVDKAVDDLNKLDLLLREQYGYQITMSRPPHYVDKMQDGFTSYDVYDRLGYQYMAASFDGAGWLPSTLSGEDAALEAEVNAMVEPMRKALEKDPEFFCGQIIFQKDGYNMARRSPIAHGLDKQLELLAAQGYKVVTVSQLMALSPFLDIPQSDPRGAAAKKLLEAGWCPVYRDNSLRPDSPLTRGELAMMAFGWEAVDTRIALVRGEEKLPWPDLKPEHPYAAPLLLAARAGCLSDRDGKAGVDAPVTGEEVRRLLSARLGKAPETVPQTLTHGDFFLLVAPLV